MTEAKKVVVVLNTAGDAVDATKSVVTVGTIGSMVKQQVPFLAEDGVAFVGGETTQNLVKAVVLGAAAVAGDHYDVKSKIGLGE